KKNIIEYALCPYGCNEVENVEHLLFKCPYATQVWTALGFALNQQTKLAQVLLAADNNQLGPVDTEAATILIAKAWNIWLAKNRKVFDNVIIPCSAINDNVVQTLYLWKHRTRKETKEFGYRSIDTYLGTTDSEDVRGASEELIVYVGAAGLPAALRLATAPTRHCLATLSPPPP
ncbi:hypothetical protein BDA96_10G219800, partial [Sorghum bicolor]